MTGEWETARMGEKGIHRSVKRDVRKRNMEQGERERDKGRYDRRGNMRGRGRGVGTSRKRQEKGNMWETEGEAGQ